MYKSTKKRYFKKTNTKVYSRAQIQNTKHWYSEYYVFFMQLRKLWIFLSIIFQIICNHLSFFGVHEKKMIGFFVFNSKNFRGIIFSIILFHSVKIEETEASNDYFSLTTSHRETDESVFFRAKQKIYNWTRWV